MVKYRQYQKKKVENSAIIVDTKIIVRCVVIILGKFIDLTGKKFNRLTVMYRNGHRSDVHILWHCKCDCGNEVDVGGNSLKSGNTKSCGCLNIQKISERNIKDLTGKRFGNLVVSHIVGKTHRQSVIWRCKCDCGNVCDVVSHYLLCGDTKSCGCLVGEYHRMSKTNFYTKYKNMLVRCYKPSSYAYRWYGNLGITVCDRWKNSFLAFKEDMYETYLDHCEKFGEGNTTLDRINPYKNYEPSNCRWATWEEQRENKRIHVDECSETI